MDRRAFLKTVAAGAAGAAGLAASRGASAEAAATSIPRPARLGEKAKRIRVGCQRRGSSPKYMPFLIRHGVEGICISPAKSGPEKIWTPETCAAARKPVDDIGLAVESMYWGVPIDVLFPDRRDAAIERCRKQIAAAGKGGIPALAYTLHVRVWGPRTGRAPGRGGATYSEWDLSKVTARSRGRNIGPIDAEEMWDRITYFLKGVVPVAHESKVKLSCHPPDPPMPYPNQFKIAQVLGTVEGLKKFVTIQDSPYHGLTFCQGCVWEMLPDKRKGEFYDIIRWFAKRGKIVQAHFRNLRGNRERFAETYHDNGDIDMFKAVLAYKEGGYTGILMPDHVPRHGEDGPDTGFAYAYGYIKGLIQAAYSMDARG